MTRLPITQIDAFAERAFAGNPAAVMPLDGWLDDAVLQVIGACLIGIRVPAGRALVQEFGCDRVLVLVVFWQGRGLIVGDECGRGLSRRLPAGGLRELRQCLGTLLAHGDLLSHRRGSRPCLQENAVAAS